MTRPEVAGLVVGLVLVAVFATYMIVRITLSPLTP